MLFLFSIWLVLSLVAAGVGLAFTGGGLLASARDSAERGEDMLLFSAWIGIAMMSMAAFAWALVLPLDAIASGLILLAAIVVSGWGWRRAVRAGAIGSPWKLAITLCLIAAILAERSTPVGNLDDAGGYHWSLIRWYGEEGIPVGLGLFQWRLATHSSWLAFSALLNHGPLSSRVGNVANGLLLLWALVHFIVVVARMLKGVAREGDVLLATAMFLILSLMLGWEMRMSPSPDIPALLSCIVVAWAWLQLSDIAKSKSESFKLLLVGMSAFAVTVKLNALPLLLSVTLIVLWEARREPVRWGRYLAAAVVPALLLVLASFMTTGCALFPSPALCFEVPWGVGAATAKQYSELINSSATRNIGEWLIASGVALGLIVPRLCDRGSTATRGVVLIAAAGVAFTLLFAPTTRFGLGYLVLLPSLAVACHAGFLKKMLDRLPAVANRSLIGLLVFAIAADLGMSLYKEFVYSKLRLRQFETIADRKRGDISINEFNPYWYLVPNRIAFESSFTAVRGYDFSYDVSAAGNCWDRRLPCASNPDLSFIPSIRLRDAGRGIGAGFVRRD